MSPIAIAGITVVGIAAVMAHTGWALSSLLRIRKLQTRALESYLANALLGTGVWILVSGWCFTAGGSARQIRWPMAVGFVALVAVAYWRGARIPLPRRRDGGWLSFAAACGLSVFLSLQSLSLCGSPLLFNDAITYVSVSKWLQDHGWGFGIVAVDESQPMVLEVWLYQSASLRMGSTFFLAIVQALTNQDAVYSFSAVVAWGVVLNLAGIYLLARWSLGLSRSTAAAVVLVATAGLNPLLTTMYLGFKPQLYGTAFFAFIIAVLSRCTNRPNWTIRNALLVAVLIASFLSAYSDMAPIVAICACLFVAQIATISYRRGHCRRFARFVVWTTGFTVLIGNYEFYRAWVAIRLQVNVVVGCHYPWNDSRFWCFAMGAAPFTIHDEPMHSSEAVLGIALTGLFAIGVASLVRRSRSSVLVWPLLVFAAMTFYFHEIAINPFTGTTRHTWSLYKIAKWAFPFVVVVQFAGLSALRRMRRWHPFLIVPLALFMCSQFWDVRSQYVRENSFSQIVFFESRRPVDDWEQVNARLDEQGYRKVFFLYENHGHNPLWTPAVFQYFLYPRPIVSSWPDTPWSQFNRNELLPPFSEDAALISWGKPPFDAECRPLQGAIVLLTPDRPHIYYFENLHTGERLDTQGIATIKPTPATLFIWTPSPGNYKLTCEAADDVSPMTIMRFKTPTGESHDAAVSGKMGHAVLRLPSGRSRITIETVNGMSLRLAKVRILACERSDTR